jgi:hypothetical protein
VLSNSDGSAAILGNGKSFGINDASMAKGIFARPSSAFSNICLQQQAIR